MPGQNGVHVLIQPEETGETSEWVSSPAPLHFFDYRFDEYSTEVVSLNAEFDHRDTIQELDWEKTHRKWTGETWKIDFEPLEHVVQQLLDSGYELTIEISVLRIYIADYEAPFLETIVPDESPPEVTADDVDSQLRLTDFDAEQQE